MSEELQDIYHAADRIVVDAYQRGQDETYRWFSDQLEKHKIDSKIFNKILIAFVEERKYPKRHEKCSQCGETKECKTKFFGGGMGLPCCEKCVSG